MREVVVYSASWCQGCKVVKKALMENNITFTEVDITTTEGGNKLKSLGFTSIPVTVVELGGNSYGNFVGSKPETIKQILEVLIDKNYDTY